MKHSFALVLPLLAGCSGISQAPKGSPRVELEVGVKIDPSYTSAVTGLDADFTKSFTDIVISDADVGLRFYPVLSTEYEASHARPDYVMSVDLENLKIGLDHRKVENEGEEPVLETSVRQVECSVNVTVTKRRPEGPDLTVGSHTSTGVSGASVPPPAPTYAVVRTGEDKKELLVSKTDLLRAARTALEKSLAALVPPIDRELALQGAEGVNVEAAGSGNEN